MTGPAVPPDEDREALAAALAERRRTWDPEELQEIVTDLVPVVDAIARRRAAEELRAAGDQIAIRARGSPGPGARSPQDSVSKPTP